jgi:hypothetical protein
MNTEWYIMLKRYVLEKLRSYDPHTGMFTWIRTNTSSDDFETLRYNFLSKDTRIVDIHTNKEVAVRVDLSEW